MKKMLTLSLLLTGCIYGRGRPPEAPYAPETRLVTSTHTVPTALAIATGTNRTETSTQPNHIHSWWQRFEQSELDALEQIASRNAPDVRTAEARIRRARALFTQSNAARYPNLSLSGSLNIARSNSPVGGAIDSRTASISLPIAWEVDLFARRAGTAHAARSNARAAEADRDGLLLSLEANVADAYFDLLQIRGQHALLSEDHNADRHTSELVRLRFARGLATAVDVEQARLQELNSQAQLSLLASAETSAHLRLAALLGVLPAALPPITSNTLPPFQTLSAIRTPDHVRADMVAHRPDLRAARLRVAAADSSVGAAIASRLPSIILSFTPGYSSVTSDSSFGNSTSTGLSYGAAASLSAPLFDGFLGRGGVQEQRANLLEAETGYEQLLLGAMIEVESTLALLHDEQAHHEALADSVAVAERLVAAAQDRFRLGLSDFLPVLGALRSRTSARLARLASERQLLSLQVTLHRALGGPLPTLRTPLSPASPLTRDLQP